MGEVCNAILLRYFFYVHEKIRKIKMNLTEEQKRDWNEWLSERPDNVKEVATKIVPWKTYRLKNHEDNGTRYAPVKYDEEMDGNVTITCAKFNEMMPILGGYYVFGLKPEDLIECT